MRVIFLICFLLFTSSMFAQVTKINIKNDKDITIEQAFKEIENQAPYYIAFNRTRFDADKRIHISIENTSLDEALKIILDETGFDYKITGNHIVIVENKQQAQVSHQKVSVSGYVRDADTGETLIGCYVMEPDGKSGVTTNAFGYFNMTRPSGACTIIAHYLGYAKQSINLNLMRDTVLNIKLKPSQTQLREVVVLGSQTAEKQLSRPQMSTVNLGSKEISKMPVLLGSHDVMRALQTLPGIQAANERSTGISVRGGGIDQNLFLLDDAPVFQISHIGGLFSIFNNEAVNDVKLYKGDIPANYGGRISSVTDIRLKDGNMQKFGMSGGIGLLAADLTVEGPILKDRVSYLVSGKLGGWGGLVGKVMPALDLSFYDLNIKLNAVINPKNRVYLSSYIGSDVMPVLDSKYRNNTLSLRWNHVYNPKLFSNVSLIYSNYGYRSETRTTEYTDSNNAYSWESGIRQIALKAEYNYFINDKNTLDFGASFTFNDLVPGKLEGSKQAIDGISRNNPFSNRVIEEHGVLEEALYVSNQQKITDKLSLRYGVRASFYQNLGGHWVYRLNDAHQVADSFYVSKKKTYANYFSIEPRVSINYRFLRNTAVKASYTYTSQQLQLLMKTNGGGPLDVWFPSGVNIKPQTASQYSLGAVQYLFGSTLEASIEGYYKDMRHVIDYKDGASFLDKNAIYDIDKTNYNFEEQLRTGRGYAYGVELMLKGSWRKFDGFATYSYARSKRRIEGINSGETYLSPFDKPHTFDVFLNYDLSERLSIAANFRYQSGQVTTVPAYAIEIFDKALTGYTKRNDYRLPSYQRLDLSLTYLCKKKPGRRWHGEWNFSIINALNHLNLYYANFVTNEENPNIIDAKGVYMWEFMPSLSYRFHF